MSSRCEIVRYRTNSEAVFSLTNAPKLLLPEKRLDGVNQNKESTLKTHCCGILNSAA